MYASSGSSTKRNQKLDEEITYQKLYGFLQSEIDGFDCKYSEFKDFVDNIIIGILSIGLLEDRPIAIGDLLTLSVTYYDETSSFVKNRKDNPSSNFIKVNSKLRRRSRNLLLDIADKFWNNKR